MPTAVLIAIQMAGLLCAAVVLIWARDAYLRTQPVAEPARQGSGRWRTAAVGDLTAVVDILDCLDAAGVREREVIVRGDGRFAVLWR